MKQRQISLGLCAASLASSLLLGTLGCNQAKGGSPASAKPCDDFSARLCKEAGDQSTTCTSVKSTVELFTPDTCAAALKQVDHALAKLGEKKKKCDELQIKLCKDLGETTQTCDMVKTHTKTFPPERCEMMLGRYAEVLGDLKKQEEKNKPLAADAIKKLSEGAAPAFGPADAKVTIVEFSDFQCPYCSQAATTVTQLKQKYGSKVRFVFRQFPLAFHQNAHVSAEAALAAHAQGKFWELHDLMFKNQTQLDRPSLEKYAKTVGLDMDAFKKALDDKTYAATVDAEMKLGESVGVDATPTMFLNGARVSRPNDLDAISKQIEEALNKPG